MVFGDSRVLTRRTYNGCDLLIEFCHVALGDRRDPVGVELSISSLSNYTCPGHLFHRRVVIGVTVIVILALADVYVFRHDH
jgi:hypothetical protein